MGKKFISTNEVARILGITRQAVFKKIKTGQIRARKMGRNFFIDEKDFLEILDVSLSEKRKGEIERAVNKTISEYGETLKLLGQE